MPGVEAPPLLDHDHAGSGAARGSSQIAAGGAAVAREFDCSLPCSQKLVLRLRLRAGSCAEGTSMVELMTAFGDDLHDVLREAALAGPLARDPGDRRRDRVAPRRRRRARPRPAAWSVSVSANFDLMGITDGPLRDWYGSLMFTNEGAAHRRLRLARAEGVHAARGRRDPRSTAAEMAARRRSPACARTAAAISSPRRRRCRCRVICRLIGVPDADVASVRRLGRRAERRVRVRHARAGGRRRRSRWRSWTSTSTSCSSSGARRPATTS